MLRLVRSTFNHLFHAHPRARFVGMPTLGFHTNSISKITQPLAKAGRHLFCANPKEDTTLQPGILFRSHGNFFNMYFGDQTPENILKNGIKARGARKDLYGHVVAGGHFGYVSFSKSESVAKSFAFGPHLMIFAVDPDQQGIDPMPKVLGDPRMIEVDPLSYQRISNEGEIAFEDKVKPENIFMIRPAFGFCGFSVYTGKPTFNLNCPEIHRLVKDTSEQKEAFATPVNLFRGACALAASGAIAGTAAYLATETEESEKPLTTSKGPASGLYQAALGKNKNAALLLFFPAGVKKITSISDSQSSHASSTKKSGP